MGHVPATRLRRNNSPSDRKALAIAAALTLTSSASAFGADDTAEQIRQRHIQYAVVSGSNLGFKGTTLAAWLERTHAELIATVTATVTVKQGPEEWFVLRFPQ